MAKEQFVMKKRHLCNSEAEEKDFRKFLKTFWHLREEASRCFQNSYLVSRVGKPWEPGNKVTVGEILFLYLYLKNLFWKAPDKRSYGWELLDEAYLLCFGITRTEEDVHFNSFGSVIPAEATKFIVKNVSSDSLTVEELVKLMKEPSKIMAFPEVFFKFKPRLQPSS